VALPGQPAGFLVTYVLAAAVQASMRGYWPHPSGLAVLAGYAVVFTVAAARFFRWD